MECNAFHKNVVVVVVVVWIVSSCHYFYNRIWTEKLYLSNNEFTGEIPDTIWNMTSLVELSLSNNFNLTGQLGTDLFMMSDLGAFTTNIYRCFGS
jgi:hypothetical protein